MPRPLSRAAVIKFSGHGSFIDKSEGGKSPSSNKTRKGGNAAAVFLSVPSVSKHNFLLMLKNRQRLKITCFHIVFVLVYFALFIGVTHIDYEVQEVALSEDPLAYLGEEARESVSDRESYWSWLEGTFLGALISVEDANGATLADPMTFEYFKLMGGATIETYDSPAEDCNNDAWYFYGCYDRSTVVKSTSRWVDIYTILNYSIQEEIAQQQLLLSQSNASNASNAGNITNVTSAYTTCALDYTVALANLNDKKSAGKGAGEQQNSLVKNRRRRARNLPVKNRRLKSASSGGSSSGGTSSSVAKTQMDTTAGSAATLESSAESCLAQALQVGFAAFIAEMRATGVVSMGTSYQEISLALYNAQLGRYSVLKLRLDFERSGEVRTSYLVGSAPSSNRLYSGDVKRTFPSSDEFFDSTRVTVVSLYIIIFVLTLYKLGLEVKQFLGTRGLDSDAVATSMVATSMVAEMEAEAETKTKTNDKAAAAAAADQWQDKAMVGNGNGGVGNNGDTTAITSFAPSPNSSPIVDGATETEAADGSGDGRGDHLSPVQKEHHAKFSFLHPNGLFHRGGKRVRSLRNELDEVKARSSHSLYQQMCLEWNYFTKLHAHPSVAPKLSEHLRSGGHDLHSRRGSVSVMAGRAARSSLKGLTKLTRQARKIDVARLHKLRLGRVLARCFGESRALKLLFMMREYEAKLYGYLFLDKWNIIDLTVYFLVLSTMGLILLREARIKYLQEMQENQIKHTVFEPSDKSAYVAYQSSFGDLVEKIFSAASAEFYLMITRSITIVCMGIRVLKPFEKHPKLAIVTRTLSSALSDLKYFVVIVTPMFFAYVFAGHLLFGSRLKSAYGTIPDSAITSMNLILLGEHSWDEMWNGNNSNPMNLAGLVYFWTFLALMFLLMLNILLAIVMDSYAGEKEAMNDEEQRAGNKDGESISLVDSVLELCQDAWYVVFRSLALFAQRKRGGSRKYSIRPDDQADNQTGENGESAEGSALNGTRSCCWSLPFQRPSLTLSLRAALEGDKIGPTISAVQLHHLLLKIGVGNPATRVHFSLRLLELARRHYLEDGELSMKEEEEGKEEDAVGEKNEEHKKGEEGTPTLAESTAAPALGTCSSSVSGQGQGGKASVNASANTSAAILEMLRSMQFMQQQHAADMRQMQETIASLSQQLDQQRRTVALPNGFGRIKGPSAQKVLSPVRDFTGADGDA